MLVYLRVSQVLPPDSIRLPSCQPCPQVPGKSNICSLEEVSSHPISRKKIWSFSPRGRKQMNLTCLKLQTAEDVVQFSLFSKLQCRRWSTMGQIQTARKLLVLPCTTNLVTYLEEMRSYQHLASWCWLHVAIILNSYTVVYPLLRELAIHYLYIIPIFLLHGVFKYHCLLFTTVFTSEMTGPFM